MKKYKIFLTVIIIFITLKINSQSPIEVVITGDCNPTSGTFNYSNTLNGKYNYLRQVLDIQTNELIDFQIGFNGSLWIFYVDNDLTNVGFYNSNIPNGMLPPNTGWEVLDCDNGELNISGGSTSAINGFNYLNDITVFPNPVKSVLTIKINNPILKDIKITIYDTLGGKIFSSNYISNNNKIDTINWSKGIYILKILNKNRIIKSSKLIII